MRRLATPGVIKFLHRAAADRPRDFALQLSLDRPILVANILWRGQTPDPLQIMTPRVTLRDIARRANVHVSTVSLALRDSPRLPDETRFRVQAMAREMGYVHDSVLDALLAYRDSARRRARPQVLGYV